MCQGSIVPSLTLNAHLENMGYLSWQSPSTPSSRRPERLEWDQPAGGPNESEPTDGPYSSNSGGLPSGIATSIV